MGQNRSKARKDERIEKAKERELKKLYRDCGHWHTENGMAHCPYGKES